jgi:hypothetical protein
MRSCEVLDQQFNVIEEIISKSIDKETVMGAQNG